MSSETMSSETRSTWSTDGAPKSTYSIWSRKYCGGNGASYLAMVSAPSPEEAIARFRQLWPEETAVVEAHYGYYGQAAAEE